MSEILFYQSGQDNCMQCCLAGLMRVPLAEVLDVNTLEGEKRDNWLDVLTMYMELRHKHTLEIIPPDHPVECMHIQLVRPMKDDGCHAVICYPDGTVKWDPYPEGRIYKVTICKIVLVQLTEEGKKQEKG